MSSFQQRLDERIAAGAHLATAAEIAAGLERRGRVVTPEGVVAIAVRRFGFAFGAKVRQTLIDIGLYVRAVS